MNSSPTEVAHIQIPNVRENVKMENKPFQIINPKKENISQQKPAVITNFWPTLPTTVPGAEREAGGPKSPPDFGKSKSKWVGEPD